MLKLENVKKVYDGVTILENISLEIEEEVLQDTAAKLKNKMSDMIARGVISPESRIIMVNDGSMDQIGRAHV